MYVRQTIELRPNNKQRTYFRQCFGARRLAYNYGLAEWIRLRDSGEKTKVRAIRATFNAKKAAGLWPFLKKLSCGATTFAFDDLQRAFDNFFDDHERVGQGNNDRLTGFPQPKGKSYNTGSYTEYFSKDGTGMKILDPTARRPRLKLPKLKQPVRMTRPLRYDGRPVSVTIRQHNERFYACFMVEITADEFLRTHPRYAHQPTASVGIDLGIAALAVTSDGISIDNPRPAERQHQRENLLQERMNRCTGKRADHAPSRRYLRAKQRLWHLRTHIRNQREDLRNKLCAALLANYQHIAIETLSVQRMADSVEKRKSKRKLNLHLADVSLYEIRHRLQTLGALLGRDITLAPGNFPSTRRCSRCGHVNPHMPTDQRTYHCPHCGHTADRDLNAATNLLQLIPTNPHTGRGTSGETPEAPCPCAPDLIRSNIQHRHIGNGKRAGTRS